MAITESRKQSDLEKRLKILRQQAYGKREFQVKNIPSSNLAPQSTSLSSDVAYLSKDLKKIALLSTLALGIQLILYFLLKNHALNLNFF